MEKIKYKYICEECGGTEVAGKVWVNLNDTEQIVIETASFNFENYWCNNCLDYVHIKSEKIK